ncbi:LLM class flavin-dependent oxidoreductase [Rhodopila sp.]|jgi:alkanesulfonate monooxygenase SsuD/methylene tetrahydromethanopterin reductase-like flavin-dependent oxidoreductase (luciferase family)|uniref:LLM class flavin-dependent oxidoreductase n=1 Tax=Rhodopila sp. TaxID=2480087 RepID=UPI002B838A08|nr:LLM class flavin-dependent oxidoreductase [Rhodopila sp.]HVZ09799.1 LLM class flavin-dependent oxidoreductase [Rhodopila sp.]
MRVGLFLFHESRYPSADAQVIDEAVQEARLAEAEGMDAVFLVEHHFDGNCAYVDPPTFAAAMAMATSRIKIGFAVLQTSLYHPLRMAEQIALIDNLSKGRLIVGLGRGSLVNLHEYAGYQIDPDTAQERFEEIEDILLKCWTQEKVAHAGKYWNFEIPMLRPRPYTKPYPQTLRSVASEASLAAQARLGRPVLMAAATAPGAARNIQIYRNAAREAGLHDDAIDEAISQCWVARTVVLAPTDAEARDVGLPYFQQMQTYRAAQSSAFEAQVAKANASGRLPVLCGSPDSMMDDFTSLAKTGIGGVIVRFRTGPMPADFSTRALKLFMRDIAPRIRH